MFEFHVSLKDDTTGVETVYVVDARSESEAVALAIAENPNAAVTGTHQGHKLSPGAYYHRFI